MRATTLSTAKSCGTLDLYHRRTNATAIGKLLLDLQEQEQTMLVVVTHSVELAQLLQRRLELDNGVLKEL